MLACVPVGVPVRRGHGGQAGFVHALDRGRVECRAAFEHLDQRQGTVHHTGLDLQRGRQPVVGEQDLKRPAEGQQAGSRAVQRGAEMRRGAAPPVAGALHVGRRRRRGGQQHEAAPPKGQALDRCRRLPEPDGAAAGRAFGQGANDMQAVLTCTPRYKPEANSTSSRKTDL